MIKATQCPGNNGSRVKNERLTKSGTEGKGLKSQTHPPSLRRVGVRKYSAGKPRLKPEKTARQGHAGWPPEAQQGPGLKGQTQPPGLRRESPHGKDMDRKPPPEAAPGMAENRRKKRAARQKPGEDTRARKPGNTDGKAGAAGTGGRSAAPGTA